MRPTVPYIQARFDEFNRTLFDGSLPAIPLELSRAASYVGVCTYKSRRKPFGRVEHYDFKIRISTRFDLPEEEVDDTIIHEMIHYYIWLNRIKDTSTHGKVFREMMEKINREHGRHVTVTHHSTKEQREAAIDRRPKPHIVAIVTFRDGRQGVKLLPRIAQRISRYHAALMRSGKVAGIEYFLETDPWFNRYPTSSAFNVVFAPMDEVRAHITGTVTLDVTARSVTVNGLKPKD